MTTVGAGLSSWQAYNPWGYTYRVPEDQFVTGYLDGVDAGLPSTAYSVRVPAT